MNRFIAVYITPPTVFVAVLIGGGYGTGREIVEFFSRHGLYGGLAGIAIAAVLLGTIFGLTFDFARRTGNYEYADFFKALIGRFWWIFEVLYLLLAVLVLGVLSAAAGNILTSEYGLGTNMGLTLILSCVALMVFFGRVVLQRILTGWTLGMYTLFTAYFFLIFKSLDTAVIPTDVSITTAGVASGALYVMYNAAIAPVLLFAARGIETRREAIASGFLTALVLMTPAAFFHVSFSLAGDVVLQQAIPVYWMIEQHAPDAFRTLFALALLGTLAQTGAGLIHGFIERVEHAAFPDRDDAMKGKARIAIALAALTLSWLLAQIGVIDLIARGYSALGIGFAFIYALPLFVQGIRNLLGRR